VRRLFDCAQAIPHGRERDTSSECERVGNTAHPIAVLGARTLRKLVELAADTVCRRPKSRPGGSRDRRRQVFASNRKAGCTEAPHSLERLGAAARNRVEDRPRLATSARSASGAIPQQARPRSSTERADCVARAAWHRRRRFFVHRSTASTKAPAHFGRFIFLRQLQKQRTRGPSGWR